MSERYRAGAYWGRRLESAEECARRAEQFFRLLAGCHPSYARWYEQASSPEKSLQLPFEPTRDTFAQLFSKKKYQMGRDGFSFSAWTGHLEQDQGGVVVIHCSGDAAVSPNGVLLHFPAEPLGHERMLTASVVTGVMRALALAWEPDWSLATASNLWQELSRQGEAETFVGWMTYISRRWGGGELPPLPDPVRVEQVQDQGSLIVLNPTRLTMANPEHVALGHRVQRTLEERGLLKRLLDRQPTGS